MSVHQLKDGRFIVQYRDKLDWRKKRRKYFRRDEEKKAYEFDASLDKKQGARDPDRHSWYFEDLVNEYARARRAHMENSSIDNLRIKMTGVILPVFGHLRAMNITPQRVDQFVAKRLKKVKKTTVHRDLSYIKAILNWAVGRGLIAFNPIEKYEMPKRDDEVIRPPTEAEIKSIWAHASGQLRRAIALCYYTGLRHGQKELYSLKWTDVDFEGATIRITSAKKGGVRYRDVPLRPQFLETLKQWHADDGLNGSHILSYRGNPYRTSVKKAFKNAKEKAGIKRRIRMYDIRHAFATLALKHGADLKSTSQLIGHTRTDTTTRIYQHIDFEMQKDVVRRVPALDLDFGNPSERVIRVDFAKQSVSKG